MKTIFSAAALTIAALCVAQPGSAAVFPITVTDGSNFFGNTGLSNGTGLSDMFTFTLSQKSLADASVITVSLNGLQKVDFTSITLDGHAFTEKLTTPEVWYLDPTVLSAGAKQLTLNYNVSGTSPDHLASYSGTLNLGSVPEPATWTLLIAGFAIVGGAMRRKRLASAFVAI